MRVRRIGVLGIVAAALVVIATGATAQGTSKLPTPGSPGEVAALVAASTGIKKVPSNLLPPLSQVSSDGAAAYYGVVSRECIGVTKCVFGDRQSSTLLVMFGDSHAQMWLPAFVPIAQRNHFKVALVWDPGCPAADVSVWDASTHAISASCNSFRAAMIPKIIAAKPALVLLGDRTSDVPGAGNHLIPNATWKAGLEATIARFTSAAVKVAVIGDITAFDKAHAVPACLAANLANVQACSVPNPNPKTPEHFAAEMAAATAEGVDYLNPQPWLCTTVCSQIVGTMAAYYDSYHVSGTYAEYLTLDWQHLLATDGLLPR